jgi:hypothetical protein
MKSYHTWGKDRQKNESLIRQDSFESDENAQKVDVGACAHTKTSDAELKI